MFRLAIILIGIAWASLLLISWSGPTDALEMPLPANQETAARS